MFRGKTEIAGNARVGGVTYIVTVDAPLPNRPRFVRVTVEADDGRKASFNLPDDRYELTGAEAAALGMYSGPLPPHLRPEEAAR